MSGTPDHKPKKNKVPSALSSSERWVVQQRSRSSRRWLIVRGFPSRAAAWRVAQRLAWDGPPTRIISPRNSVIHFVRGPVRAPRKATREQGQQRLPA